ncbi:MAG: type II toxin-antitoxin system VapC family toxin [Steroidobacteraceae bacterium]|nr:type II toxin-antitoxin system VapC family toxin [Steroidobacteraceae bacterium]
MVDSSGWLEFLSDGPNAGYFAPAIERTSDLVVPTLSIFEVFKRILQQRDESQALQAVALMYQGRLADLTAPLAMNAARLSRSARLPMADSIMLATARVYGATFWTQDADFAQMPGVRYRAAGRPA